MAGGFGLSGWETTWPDPLTFVVFNVEVPDLVVGLSAFFLKTAQIIKATITMKTTPPTRPPTNAPTFTFEVTVVPLLLDEVEVELVTGGHVPLELGTPWKQEVQTNGEEE
jgi:hypothetical protein